MSVTIFLAVSRINELVVPCLKFMKVGVYPRKFPSVIEVYIKTMVNRAGKTPAY